MAEILQRYAAGKELLSALKLVDEATRTTITTITARLVSEATAGDKENVNQQAPVELHGHSEPGLLGQPRTLLCTIPDIALAHPKGKYSLTAFQEGLLFKNAKSELNIPAGDIQHVVILDQFPKDSKGRLLLMLVLKDGGVTVGKQQLDTILIQTTATAELKGLDGQPGPAVVVLCSLLGCQGVTDFIAADPAVYTSAIKSPAVAATHKVTQGYLFPLDKVFCFVEKPALLIHHRNIKWVELQRIDRVTATFDLVIHLVPGQQPRKVELSQIERSELGRLQSYLQTYRLKTQEPLAGSTQQTTSPSKAGKQASTQQASLQAAPEPEEGDDDSDDEDEEDEDFNPAAGAGSEDDEDEDEGEGDSEDASGSGGDEEEEEAEEGGSSGQGQAKAVAVQVKQQRVAAAAATKAAEADEEDIGDEDDDESDEDEDDEYESDDGDDDSMEEEEPLDTSDVQQPPAKRARGGAR